MAALTIDQCTVDEFWARYDWSDPEAALHLQEFSQQIAERVKQAKANVKEKEVAAEDQVTKDTKVVERDPKPSDPPEVKTPPDIPVEWTCGGLEEILGTVGIQCAYKTEVRAFWIDLSRR